MNVSATKPNIGEPTVIYVGGSYVDLGCPEAKGRLGLAPFDPANANRSDVGFVFSAPGSSAGALAQTIVHVAGHAFGLDHVTNNQDIMYAWASNAGAGLTVSPMAGGSAVQDGPAVLRQVLTMPWNVSNGQAQSFPQPPLYLPGVGYIPAGSPSVPGFAQLAAVSQLTSALGPSQVVDISLLAPRLRSVFAQSLNQTSLAGFERVATVLALVTRAASAQKTSKSFTSGFDGATNDEDFQDANLSLNPNNGGQPTGPSGLFIDGTLVGQYLGAQGAGQVTLDRLATAAGFQNIDAAVKAIQAGLSSGALKFPTDSGFSDLASVFNLPTNVMVVPSLFTGFWSSAYYVKGSLTGLNLSGMNAALKVAYYQRYQTLANGPNR